MLVMVRTLEQGYELRHAGCVGEGEHIEGVASPMQPNRYDFEDADEYERAVTAAFACARCGEDETGGGDGSGTASGAGDADGSGEGRGSAPGGGDGLAGASAERSHDA